MALPSSSTGPKKQRQTRIPEHLKAVKKSSSSSSLKSAASSSSAATTAAESASSVPSAASSAAHGGQLQAPRKSDISGNVKKSSSSSSSKTKQQMKKLHRLDTAAVPDTYVKASSPYAVSSSGLPASPYEAYPLTSPVRSANNSGVAAPSSSSSSSAISMGLPAIATSDHLTSPLRFNTTTTQYQAGQQLPIQIHHHHHQQQHTFLPANGQDQHQATLHSLNGSTHASSAVTSSVPARLPYGHLNAYAQGPGCAQAQLPSPSKVPYAVTNEHANELAASLERSASHGAFSYQPEQQMQMQMQMPLHNMANMSYAPPMTPSYSATHPTIPPGSSAALARSCSSQTSSMMMTQSYSQPAFTFAVPLAGSHNMSPQQQHPPQGAIYHGNQLAQAGPGSFGNGINHNNASSPAVSLHSGSSTGSISSAQSQAHSHEGYARSPRRSQTSMSGLSSISATPFSSMSAGSNIASAAHGAAAAVPSSSTPLANSYSATSPRTPGNGMASAAFSAPLLLSISSDGKACLTPQMRRSTDMSPLASVAEENSTPKPLRPTAMTRSSTMNSHKLPTRPSMMRSITTDPRMNSSSNNVKHDSLSASNNGKQEVSELDGVGRVVGQGKMFDLHDGKHALASSTSADRHIAALPRTLNLNIEMDLASGTGSTAGQTYSFSQVAYPPLTFSPNGMLLTPPQSTELANQQLPGSSNIPKQPHHMQHAVPFYPEKERFQSSWKFPSGMGLNLVNSDRKQSLQQGDPSASAASSPSSGIQSSFPSMTSLNASIVNVIKGQDDRAGPLSPANKTPNSSIGGASEDMSRRQSRIQAWLDSPEMHEGDNGGASSWSSLPPRDDQDHGSAPPTASSSESFSISPASIMTRTASELKLSSDSDFIEYEEFEVMRASGKSIQPLRVSRKRRYDDDDSGLSSKDRDAIKAGLGLPFQAIAPQREVTPTLTDGGSPGKKSKALKPDDEAAGASAATKLVKPSPTKKAPVKKGRKSKKKGSSKCICGETDNGDAMIQCDECASWFHLVCVDVDAENLPDEWHCPNCLEAQRPEQNGEEERQAQAAYPSPSSPSPSMLDLSVQETPKRPTISREPTFSKDATPKSASVRHFQDTHLALAPSPGPGAIPSTPQNTPAQFSAFHNRTASYSRSYAPVTPRQGFSAQVSAPGTGYQWDTYSPHTPSNSIIHARRPSRSHFKTPSSTWAALSHYAEVPSSSSRHGDEERTKQWEQFYNAPAPNPINPIPMTPPLTSHAPFASSESFLPPLEQEASVSQRFLAIHSTPSSWDDSSQFPSNMW